MRFFSAIPWVVAVLLAQPAVAERAGSTKGIIVKITDSGDDNGQVITNPLTTNPAAVVAKLNAEGVREARVQVNDGAVYNDVTFKGSSVTNTLAAFGYSGQVILDNKKWDLEQPNKYNAWADMMYDTYQRMSPAGKSIVGGYSFGETTPSESGWTDYSDGIVLAVNALKSRFINDADPTNDQSLAGMKFFVGGASYNSTFKWLNATQHTQMKNAVKDVEGTMIYAYKSYHTGSGNQQPIPVSNPGDEDTVAESQDWLNNQVGLANLASVGADTQVQYRGDASDQILGNSIRKQALINIFNQHDNFLHVGAEKTLGDLFDSAGNVNASGWNRLNNFFGAVQQAPQIYAGIPTTLTHSVQVNTDSNNRPFFLSGGSSGFKGSIASGGGGASTVVRERISIVGNATGANNYADGNKLPNGVTLAFDVSFVVSATSGNLTDGGNDGLGIGSGGLLNNGEQLRFGDITLSNIVFRDPRNLIIDSTESLLSAKWNVLRSNDFAEASDGARVSADAAITSTVTNFGTSGQGAINNNYTDGAFTPLNVAFVTTTGGSWKLKGIGFDVKFNYTINSGPGSPVPEPASASLVALAVLAGLGRGRLSLARFHRLTKSLAL